MLDLSPYLKENGRKLDLSGLKLKSIPKEIENFPNIEELDISHNLLRSLAGINALPNLRRVIFRHNQVKSFRSLKTLTDLQIIDGAHNQLLNLNYLQQLVNLQELNVENNRLLDLTGIENLVGLEILICNRNELTKIIAVQNLENLRIFICSDNQIQSLKGIEGLHKLQNFNCWRNQISSLDGIDELIELATIQCGDNQISTLQNLSKLTKLDTLTCYRNRITSIKPITKLINLRELNFSLNSVESVEGIQYLHQLRDLGFSDNPITHIPPHIERFLHRIWNYNTGNFYEDNQNIHNSSVSKTARESISNLLTEYHSLALTGDALRASVIESPLDEKCKSRLFEYFESLDVHSVLLTTFEEVFAVVWYFIQSQIVKTELYQRLEEELDESECKCFTGRLIRVVNTLNGFSPLVQIGISEREQCGNLMALFINEGLDGEKLRQRFEEACAEREVELAIVEEFINGL